MSSDEVESAEEEEEEEGTEEEERTLDGEGGEVEESEVMHAFDPPPQQTRPTPPPPPVPVAVTAAVAAPVMESESSMGLPDDEVSEGEVRMYMNEVGTS